MNTNRSVNQRCERVMEHLDTYLDGELPGELREELAAHLPTCAACTREHSNREAFRLRLKNALSGVTAAPELTYRIQQSVRTAQAASGWNRWRGSIMTIAATVTICIGGVTAYQAGHLRFTAASQESYLSSISQQVAGIMRVGLGDHVHCAVFRKLPKTRHTLEQMVRETGPQYKDLIGVVDRNVPKNYRLMTAHQCRYHGRQFVHLAATDGSQLMSLVVAKRADGESFTKDNLVPILSASGIQIYQTGVQRFEVAGFETRDHLVYVVTESGAKHNTEIMKALAADVRSVLARIES